MVNVDDDGIKMFGMVLIVAIILILLSTCVLNQDTGEEGMECPEGTYYLEKFNCCTMDGLTCFVPPSNCDIVPCDDEKLCCAPDVCEVQPDKTEKCLPCDEGSTCIPLELPCCENMFCLNGFCENCQDYPCNSEEDCCDDYECFETQCKACDRPCSLELDCCSGWECSIGKCEDCDRPCDPTTPCCDGDACSTNGKCEGCEEGAYCSIEKPCCPGYSCNLDTNECEPCVGKVCESSDDCCPGDKCNLLTKKCQSTENCEDLPCENIGETCEICDETGCEDCLDKSVCANIGGIPLCKKSGGCGEGQVLCSSIGKSYTNCVCCDAISGECVDDTKKVECSDIENCEICSCLEPYDVAVCPTSSGYPVLYCKDRGCFNVLISDPVIIDQACQSCSMSSLACCTFLVPADAEKMADVTHVKTTECLSGYKHKGNCVLKVDYFYDIEAEIYTYSFLIYGQTSVTGTSKVGPNEVVVSTVRIESKDICDTMGDDRFFGPTWFRVGG